MALDIFQSADLLEIFRFISQRVNGSIIFWTQNVSLEQQILNRLLATIRQWLRFDRNTFFLCATIIIFVLFYRRANVIFDCIFSCDMLQSAKCILESISSHLLKQLQSVL